MSDDNLVLTLLRETRDDQRDFKERITNVEVRMTGIEQQVAALVIQPPSAHDRIDRMERRLAYIERRLEIAE